MTIYGASGHAKVVKDIIIDNCLEIFQVVDDKKERTTFDGHVVLSSAKINASDTVIIAIGANSVRQEISKKIDASFSAPLVHSTATVSVSATMEKGTVVMPLAAINAASQIGKHCIINSSSIIEHDCIIGDYAHISPGAILTGGVTIGEGTHVGAGAVILPNIRIGKWVTIGAGAVILKNIPDYSIVVGNPGRIIKRE
ncbi:acetyltransferase [Flavobacteriaceae bacterium YJPT1-3]|nr:acetyltransferase [Flavobacteriaceae bacterium YJPT1-3]